MATTVDEFGNIIPDEDTQSTQQNAQYQNSGGADDDSGSPTTYYENDGTASSTAAEQIYYENDGTASSTTSVMQQSTSTAATPNAGSTVSGKSGAAGSTKNSKPTRRLYNPLANFSSYTYQLSLYMITPDAYNAFVTSGKKNINAISNFNNAAAASAYNSTSSGVYLVAQSGGINNNVANRAPGFNLDYYLDNLEISSAIAMGKSEESSGPTNTVNIKFQVIEPYGFSFITKLKQAQDALQHYSSSLPNVDKNPFADRSMYILGIRFLGYDANGNIVSGLEQVNGNTLASATATPANGSFETFYDIKITDMTFKLDGRAVTYNVTAVSAATQEGMGLKNGRILTDTTAVGSDVDSMINDLFANINKAQKDLQGNAGVEIPNQYKVVYIGPDGNRIKSSSVANTVVDADKTKYPALTAVTTDGVNTASGIKSTVKGNQREMIFKGGGSTSILQAIQLIVTQSDYIQQAIKDLYTNDPEPDRKTKDYQTADTNSNKVLKWINVSTQIINLGYDRLRKDFAYEITYIIQSYETPVVNVVTAGNLPKYYGPSKRYQYWLTGKNTEVVRFELAYNQLFNTIAVGNLQDQQNKLSPIPVMVGHRAAAPRQGRLGVALESQNAYVNFLNDPGAYASAKITIMGDPDWLVQDNASAINAVFDKYYGTDGFTINCNSGQVFIEVDFKEAIDYDNTKGVMSVNDKLMFFDYPDVYKSGPNKIQGIAFTVTDVVSTFKGGKFEQTLACAANIWDKDASASASETSRESSTADGARTMTSQGSTAGTNPTGTKSTGFTKEPPSIVNDTTSASTSTSTMTDELGNPIVTDQSTSPTGGSGENTAVADDDSSGIPTQTVSYNEESGREETDSGFFS